MMNGVFFIFFMFFFFYIFFYVFFFFQAEDGIRDKLVTGVQTCALPICAASAFSMSPESWVFERFSDFSGSPLALSLSSSSGRLREEVESASLLVAMVW